MKTVVLLLIAALAAPAATFYLTIAGLGGEPDYVQRFKMWADDIDGSLKKAGGDASVVTLNAPHLQQIRERFAEFAKQAKPADAVVVILIGHGTWDGHDYKFNIPGPDLTSTELAALLDRVPAGRQLVVNMTSCSGGSIEQLRRANRIVIAATRTGSTPEFTARSAWDSPSLSLKARMRSPSSWALGMACSGGPSFIPARAGQRQAVFNKRIG